MRSKMYLRFVSTYILCFSLIVQTVQEYVEDPAVVVDYGQNENKLVEQNKEEVPIVSNTMRKILGRATPFPGVHAVSFGDDFYRSDFCKQPPKKLKPEGHQFLLHGTSALSDSGKNTETVSSKDTTSSPSAPKAPSAPKTPDSRFTLPLSTFNGFSGLYSRAKVSPPNPFIDSVANGTANGSRRKLLGKGKAPPKRPSGWGKGHPNANDYKFISDAVENRQGFCPFAIKECVKPGVKGHAWVSAKGPRMPCCQGKDKSCCKVRKNLLMEKDPVSQEQWEKMPSVPKGNWGSCALVALGDCMMRSKKGPEIDNHDLVIRLGHAPIKGYEEHVGSRTDVVYARGASTRMMESMHYKDTKFYLGHCPSYEHVASVNGSAVDYPPGTLEQIHDIVHKNPRLLPDNLYKSMTTPIGWKPRGQTSGFVMAINLIFSGLCERIDLYGFSDNGGFEYYQKIAMKLHHSIELETFVFHYLMQNFSNELHMCVNI